MSSLPAQTSPVYCTDEDILVHAGGDFGILAPAWQAMAAGSDGAFSSGDRWTLTSASNDFESQGVAGGQVVQLTAPKSSFPGTGHFLAIDSVSSNSITLRRPYKGAGIGLPPAPAAGLSAVAFAVNTLDPQIAEASYDLKQRFAILDDALLGVQRASTWVYDLQVLRDACVYWVLVARYTQENRSERGDWMIKMNRFRSMRDAAIDRVEIRWGPTGTSAQSSTIFNTRVAR